MSKHIATHGDHAIYRDKDGLQMIVAHATERGLAIPLATSVQDFTKIGTALTSMENWSGWALGDWIVALKEAHGESAKQIMSQVFIDPSDNKVKWLAVVERVCRAFPPSERVFDLSFGHYYEVVTLDKKNRDDILCYACEHKSSTADVRLYVRNKKEEAAKANAKANGNWGVVGDDHLDDAPHISIIVDGVELVEEIVEAETAKGIPDSEPQGEISLIPSIPLIEPLVIYQIDPLGVFMAVKAKFTIEQMIDMELLLHQHNSNHSTEVKPIIKSIKKKTKDDPIKDDSTDDLPVRTLDEIDYYAELAALESVHVE